jgi:hypothetical protein
VFGQSRRSEVGVAEVVGLQEVDEDGEHGGVFLGKAEREIGELVVSAIAEAGGSQWVYGGGRWSDVRLNTGSLTY